MIRYYWDKKPEADSLKKISVFALKKAGLFDGGYRTGTSKWTGGFLNEEFSVVISVFTSKEENYMRLYYSQVGQNGDTRDFDYQISLATTPCYFGGKRYWFVCIFCSRRVGTLYKGQYYFACRHCYNLTYKSRNLSGISKLAGAIISIREVERLENEVKRKYYAGKMTRKYKSYLRKQIKSFYQLFLMVKNLEAKK
jgi:hypothetical protein